MFQLFTQDNMVQYPVTKMPEMDYVQRSYMRELLNVEDYYHNRVYAVKGQHLLNQILYHLSAPYEYNPERFVEVVRDRAQYVANAFNITSDIHPGQIHDGTFYGPGCPEILIYDDGYFDPYQIEKHWRNAVPVRPLLHPRSDMKLLLPNGRDVTDEKGLAVVTINLPLLVFQYRCFMKEQMLKKTEGQLGGTHFIHMYVLPNMNYQSTDLTVINRAMNLYYGAPLGQPRFKHAFKIVDLTSHLDRVLIKHLKYLEGTPVPYAAVLDTLPTVTGATSYNALRLPEFAPTRQIWWAMFTSRLSIIKFLIDLCGKKGIARNKGEIVQLQRDIKRLERENVLVDKLPQDLYYDVKFIMDEIMSI